MFSIYINVDNGGQWAAISRKNIRNQALQEGILIFLSNPML